MANKILNLGLQGGGAHGAFTWGVLEALLEDGRVDFRTISATSAGSMNAAVMATGLLKGGRKEAIGALESFWHRVSESGRFGIFAAPNAMQQLMGPAGRLAAGAYMGFEMLTYFFSPYQFNPLALNPLRDIIKDMVDFPLLQKSEDIRLHVCATDVRRSHLKIFSGKDLSVEALMASACLPQLFQAVEIGGQYYWDGGYMGNPGLFPLTRCKATQDILIVQIDPIVNEAVPKSGEAIADRLNEINFNSPLLNELRGLEQINQLIRQGYLDSKKSGMRELYIHLVGDDSFMAPLTLESKFNPEWGFLTGLRDAGHRRAHEWLKSHFDDLGQKSSVDLHKLLALEVG
ncbi:MAG TPA: patatin-like phospholipase family protein [Alphaproteobacteria bacterium]|nr:patatin-like phospholipase family protein [Alphaproteobacteria bacterium]